MEYLPIFLLTAWVRAVLSAPPTKIRFWQHLKQKSENWSFNLKPQKCLIQDFFGIQFFDRDINTTTTRNTIIIKGSIISEKKHDYPKKKHGSFSQTHPKTKIRPTFRCRRSVFYYALYPKNSIPTLFLGKKRRTVTFYQNYRSYVAKDRNFDKMHTPCNFLHPLKRDRARKKPVGRFYRPMSIIWYILLLLFFLAYLGIFSHLDYKYII